MMNEEPTIDRKRNDDPMTSALTRTSAVTRRAVLTGIAATGATALGACTSSAQLTDMRGDYSGEIKFDSYDTSAGTYEPATREHRAKNTPKPVKPANIDNKTVAGIYSALGHYAAAITYAINTGEDTCIQQVNMEEADKKGVYEYFGKPFTKAWVGESKCVFILKDPLPTKKDDTYTWPCTTKITIGEFAVSDGRARDISSDKREITDDAEMHLTYKDNKWVISTDALFFSSATSGTNKV